MIFSRVQEVFDKVIPFPPSSLGSAWRFYQDRLTVCTVARNTHLAYADDLLFTREDESTITVMADCQKDFGDAVGLGQNLNKFNILFCKSR